MSLVCARPTTTSPGSSLDYASAVSFREHAALMALRDDRMRVVKDFPDNTKRALGREGIEQGAVKTQAQAQATATSAVTSSVLDASGRTASTASPTRLSREDEDALRGGPRDARQGEGTGSQPGSSSTARSSTP